MFTPIENAFDAIDQHVKEISDLLPLSDDQLHQLFVMLSEHYGQLADKYNTAPDNDTDPYVEQPYCSHCGTDLRNTDESPIPQAPQGVTTAEVQDSHRLRIAAATIRPEFNGIAGMLEKLADKIVELSPPSEWAKAIVTDSRVPLDKRTFADSTKQEKLDLAAALIAAQVPAKELG